MKGLEALLGNRRLILATAVCLALVGAAAWLTMPRQEDPAFPYRNGFVLVAYPGASPEMVERLVLDPLEEELAEVEEITEMVSTARLGVAQVTIELSDTLYDTDPAWDRIRTAAERARQQFPSDVARPIVDDRVNDVVSVVYGLTGSDDPLVLAAAAERLKRRLLSIQAISRIEILGDPEEQITVTYDAATAKRLGITPAMLSRQLASRNQVQPAGELRLDGRSVTLRPDTEFDSIEELATTPIRLPSGASVPLSAVARVDYGPREPPAEGAWMDGERTVALAIVLPRDTLDIVAVGERVRQRVADLRGEFEPLHIEELLFQPDRVEHRLADLGNSLLIGILIVATVLFLAIGLRLGLLVASVIPLVTFAALAVYAIGGGVLHQISIAGMVIALGMLVDNAIVMVENIQWHMDRGLGRAEAATRSVRELAAPLAAATGTTMAAFLPMLLSPGGTGDFTRAIPIMVMLVMAVSYVFAIFVTPAMARSVLRPGQQSGPPPLQRLGRRLGVAGVRHPAVVVTMAVALIGATVWLSQFVKQDFFPSTDRNQMLVNIKYPEGTFLEATAGGARDLAAALRAQPGVRHVYAFAGNAGPRFYYNLAESPSSPFFSRLILVSDSDKELPRLMGFVRDYAASHMPDAEVVPRRLGQGPPVTAPVEVRVFADERERLARATESILQVVRDTPGIVDARHNLGGGLPTLRYAVDDQRAGAYQLGRGDIAQALQGQTSGLEVTQYRAGDDPVPVLLRSSQGLSTEASGLEALPVFNDQARGIPLAQLAQREVEWQPAVIHHRDLQRSASVFSELAQDVTYGAVTESIARRIERLNLPPGVRVSFGGDAESSGEANAALLQSLPIGGILLLFFLLWQFNSFRRVGIVLATVPLAAVGVVPGLLLTGNPFGFTAMLGVIALVGIVVNNAIVLIDVIDTRMREGAERGEAIIEAVARRTQPIVLTTLTTAGGLLPLTFTSSTLWPPMAWSIISGLLASLALTLVVIPALCRWWLREPASA